MERQRFFNNAWGTVDTVNGGTITLSAHDGLPTSLAVDEFFLMTYELPDGSDYEVVKVTDISGSDLTVDRQYEGSALSIGSGDELTCRLTAQSLQDHSLFNKTPESGDYLVTYDESGGVKLLEATGDDTYLSARRGAPIPDNKVPYDLVDMYESPTKPPAPMTANNYRTWHAYDEVNDVRAVAVMWRNRDPDNSYALVSHFSVTVYSATTNKILFTHDAGSKVDTPIIGHTTVAFSDDGSQLLIHCIFRSGASPTYTSTIHFILVDTATWTVTADNTHTESALSLSSGNDEYLESSSSLVWSTSSGYFLCARWSDPAGSVFKCYTYDPGTDSVAVFTIDALGGGSSLSNKFIAPNSDGSKALVAGSFSGDQLVRIYDSAGTVLAGVTAVSGSNPSLHGVRTSAGRVLVLAEETNTVYEADFSADSVDTNSTLTAEGLVGLSYDEKEGVLMGTKSNGDVVFYDPVTDAVLSGYGDMYSFLHGEFLLAYVLQFPVAVLVATGSASSVGKVAGINLATGGWLGRVPFLDAGDIALELE